LTVELDETHDPRLLSWVETANDGACDFPIQNLPFCVFRRAGTGDTGRIGVGIGNCILDLSRAAADGLLADANEAAERCRSSTLNALMELGPVGWRRLRGAISALLSVNVVADRRRRAESMILPIADAEFLLPANIGDFTDFFTSIFHATNVGTLFRPETPLLPNYKWVPVAYHGRTSSICLSGHRFARPKGQIKLPDAPAPAYAPCRRLDFEAELGFFVGPGNRFGDPIAIQQSDQHVFGVCLLNDWSARDIQTWENQPLGPFLAKNFASTISPWVVTLDALAPFRTAAYLRPPQDPRPLPHLFDAADQASGAFDIKVGIYLETEAMRRLGSSPHVLANVRFKDSYWTVAQLIAHHTSNGCNLRPGDLLGSGTISNAERGDNGSMIELTDGGKNPLILPDGEKRTFLEDGDCIILRATAERPEATRIGFGECRARILSAQ
jgi:fumarylacetoacetase